jgi:hypothetical protein
VRGLRPASQRVMAAVARRLAGEPLRGRIVLVRIAGRWWLHRVVDEDGDRVLIAGDNGMVDGWTPRAEVAGVLR